MLSLSNYLKWFSNLVVIAAACSLSFGSSELGKLLFFIGSFSWFMVGVIWREASIWSMNLVLVLIYILGYIQ